MLTVTSWRTIRRDELKPWKIASIASRVSRQERHPRRCGMGANEEVGQDAGSAPALSAISLKDLAG
jgi:hypothetical protein